MLTQREGIYYLDINVGGKRVRRSLHTTSKADAHYKFSDLQDKILAEHKQNEIKFDVFCEKYMAWAWIDKKPSALREGQRLEKMKVFFKDSGVVHISDVTPFLIEKLKAKLVTDGLDEQSVSRSTTNRYLAILRRLFHRAIDWGDLDKDKHPFQAKRIKFFKERRKLWVLTPEEVDKILVTAQQIGEAHQSRLQERFYDLCLMSINTGMRKSEILQARWRDLNGEDEIVVQGKGERIRTLPLNTVARETIFRQPRRTEYIFDIPNRIMPNLFYRTVETIKKKTKVKFHFHLLRHYFGSNLAKKGVDIETVRELMGHSSIITTQKYFHSLSVDKKRAVDTLVSDMGVE